MPYSARSPPSWSDSTIRRPMSQYDAVMKAFTERTADRLAAATMPGTSCKMVSYWASGPSIALVLVPAMLTSNAREHVSAARWFPLSPQSTVTLAGSGQERQGQSRSSPPCHAPSFAGAARCPHDMPRSRELAVRRPGRSRPQPCPRSRRMDPRSEFPDRAASCRDIAKVVGRRSAPRRVEVRCGCSADAQGRAGGGRFGCGAGYPTGAFPMALPGNGRIMPGANARRPVPLLQQAGRNGPILDRGGPTGLAGAGGRSWFGGRAGVRRRWRDRVGGGRVRPCRTLLLA